jgi:hypothetical protein
MTSETLNSEPKRFNLHRRTEKQMLLLKLLCVRPQASYGLLLKKLVSQNLRSPKYRLCSIDKRQTVKVRSNENSRIYCHPSHKTKSTLSSEERSLQNKNHRPFSPCLSTNKKEDFSLRQWSHRLRCLRKRHQT